MNNNQQKQLPVGIQSFADLRGRGCYYVDKTELLVELAKEKAIFLSRPRRFGKSLTLDTLAELFSGNKALFTGLYAEHNWDWSQTHPVLRISFGISESFNLERVQASIADHVLDLEQEFGVIPEFKTVSGRLKQIIKHCYQTTGQKVVILVDEYDKPMLDALHSEEIVHIRDALRSFYSVIKDSDKYIRFAMLTGISKFSKVNMFSGLNSLNDITLDKKYSALCGYTQTELESVFAERLHDVDMALVRFWYNGYNWTGESVYNPFDILLFLDKGKEFHPYWAETGTSKFLIDTLISQQTNLFSVVEETVNRNLLGKFDISDVEPVALMFQAGYLTIDKVIKDTMRGTRYTLKYPNHEVRQSINSDFLRQYINTQRLNVFNKQDNLYDYLANKRFDKLQNLLFSLYASIPHDWYRNNNIAHYEGYWASVFYSFFASAGFDICCEDSTNLGQVDMTVQYLQEVFIFEFKVIEKSDKASIDGKNDGKNQKTTNSLVVGSALRQIKEKGYAHKYADGIKSIYLFGIEFSETERNVVNIEWERYQD